MIRMLQVATLVLGIAVVAVATARPAPPSPSPADAKKTTNVEQRLRQIEEEKELLRLFADTLAQIKANYVDEQISERELINAAIRGMLAKLDPYSNYIPPKNVERFRREIEQQYGGVGIRVETTRDGQIIVFSPLYGTPAHKAGVLPGDQILKIDDTSTEGMSLDDAIALMKGKIGSSVRMTIRQPGASKARTVTLKREVIHLETVLGFRREADGHWDYFCDRDNKIAYVRLTAFAQGAGKYLAATLRSLLKDGARGLVLDLRFNPGGLLTEAVQVADLFVRDGEITSTQGRNVPTRAWNATKDSTLLPPGLPVVVLVNRFSASASEIVSACLQDHHVALVVGERTWGKASVQNIIELEGGNSVLKLTTGAYHRPSGTNIHRRPGAGPDEEWGVRPDDGHVIRMSNRELAGLNRWFHRWDVVGKPADDTSAKPFVDRQLNDGMTYLRSKLAPPKPAAKDPAKDAAPAKPKNAAVKPTSAKTSGGVSWRPVSGTGQSWKVARSC